MCEAVERAEKGLIDGNLGGCVIKQRIAREGEGKSGGFRSISFYKAATRAVFVHGFEKSAKANIKPDELEAFKVSAKLVMKLSDEQMNEAVAKGVYVKVVQQPTEEKKKSTEKKHAQDQKLQKSRTRIRS